MFTSFEKQKNLQLETTVSRKPILKVQKKTLKKRRRKNRRKICYFKRQRIKKTKEISVGLKKIDVNMDVASCDLPTEITEWQKQDQIAYWKSRAITLEIENRMLLQHIRDVYAQQYQEENKDWEQVFNYDSQSKTQNDNKNCFASDKPSKNSQEMYKSDALSPPVSSKVHELLEIASKPSTSRVQPKIPAEKNRLEEMKKIYGKTAQKIMGMETAIQLNYDRLREEESVAYWPNTPLKLY